MSTRSIVGVGTPENYKARYCHWDGYPSGVGKALWDNWKRFDWNLGRLAEFVMMTKQGWSYLAGTNFNLKPRWVESDEYDQYKEHPCWYDTRGNMASEPEWLFTQENNPYDDSYAEWAYLINLDEHRIDVYECNMSGLKFKGSMFEEIEPDYEALSK